MRAPWRLQKLVGCSGDYEGSRNLGQEAILASNEAKSRTFIQDNFDIADAFAIRE